MPRVVQRELVVIGIDPGCKGGIATWAQTGTGSGDFAYEPTPVVEVKKGRYELDLAKVKKAIRAYLYDEVSDTWASKVLAIIEYPPKIPGNGVLGTASLFKNFGEYRGILSALNIQMDIPSPQQWKKVILPGTAKDKEAAINYVVQNLGLDIPTAGPKTKKRHDGIADAICLAEYGRRLCAGNLQ